MSFEEPRLDFDKLISGSISTHGYKRYQFRSRARSISLPSRLHPDVTKENVRKLKSLNENNYRYGRDRSYTFAESLSRYNYRQADKLNNYKDTGKANEEYSPQLTKTVTSSNPLHQFQQQYTEEPTPSYGQVKIMFQYLNNTDEFHCKLLRVSDVATEISSPLGVYAKVSLSHGRKFTKRSKHKYNSNDPVFNENFIYKISLSKLIEHKLKITFYNKPKIYSLSKPLGFCVIDLSKYDITTVTVMLEEIQKVECFGQKHRDLKSSSRNATRSWKNMMFRMFRR